MNEDPTAVGNVIDPWHEAFYEAIREGDAKSIETLVAGDVVFMPPNESTMRGSPDVRQWFEGYFRRFKVEDIKETHRSVVIQDKVAFEWGSHAVKLLPQGSGQPLGDDLRFLHVWQVQSDRRWRLVRIMWNSSRPISSGLAQLLASVNAPPSPA